MAGSLLDSVRRDSKKYVTKGGFQDDIVLEAINGFSVSVTGLTSEHWINFDTDGNAVNSKNVHICVDESELDEKRYPYKNDNGSINLRNHLVIRKDSTGELKKYVITEWFPNATLGLIVCILGNYAE